MRSSPILIFSSSPPPPPHQGGNDHPGRTKTPGGRTGPSLPHNAICDSLPLPLNHGIKGSGRLAFDSKAFLSAVITARVRNTTGFCFQFVCLSADGVPPSPIHGSIWGYPLVLSLVLSWGSPRQDQGGQDGGYSTTSDTLPDETGGYPPPSYRTRYSRYAAVGTPLAVTQEDFLVLDCVRGCIVAGVDKLNFSKHDLKSVGYFAVYFPTNPLHS